MHINYTFSYSLRKNQRSSLKYLVLGISLLALASCKILAPTNRESNDPKSSLLADQKLKFTLNDASILFPPPDKLVDRDFYLGLESKDSSLIERGIYNIVKKSSNHPDMPIPDSLSARVLEYSDWRIVGFRFDPCHKNKGDTKCQGQIRLVAQPMIEPFLNEKLQIPHQLFAADFGMHLIYNISQGQVSQLIRVLRDLKTKYNASSEMQPLGIHPAFLSKEKIEFAEHVKAIIIDYSKSENLELVAFLGSAVAVTGDLPLRWLFSAYAIKKNQVIPFKIPNTEETVMRFFLAEGDGENGILPPPSPSKDSLEPALDNVRIFEDKDFATDAINKAIRIENPDLHSVETVDCVSCHIATTVRVPLEAQLFGEKGVKSKDRYQSSKQNLTRNPLFRTGPLFVHNFGFINNEPIVSQRTINETAKVVEYINSLP